jgi:hypothetical protein
MTDLRFIDYPVDQGLDEDDAWVDNTYANDDEAWEVLLLYIAKRIGSQAVEFSLLIVEAVERSRTDLATHEKIKLLVGDVTEDDINAFSLLLKDEMMPIRKVWADAYFALVNQQYGWYAEYHID